MKSFEEIAGIWLQSELFGKQYSYRKGLEKDVEHLIKYFGSRNCEEIKGMDVDKFIQYETEHVNPNTGKPFSKRLMKAHLSAGFPDNHFSLYKWTNCPPKQQKGLSEIFLSDSLSFLKG